MKESAVSECDSGGANKDDSKLAKAEEKEGNRHPTHVWSSPTFQSMVIIINIIIIIVWFVLEWTLPFLRVTSMQKAHS